MKEDYTYDTEMDMLVSYKNDQKIPGISILSLGTKKENLEKGEDEGPNILW